MSPVFSARRRADEFDSLVEAAASGRRVEDARFTDLLEFVGALREAPAPQARPEFVAGLRERLMTAAETELVPAPSTSPAAERLTVTPRRSPRERRLAVAVGGVALVGATTSMAVASQSALPGDVLYPLKRAIENAQTGVQVDEKDRGASLLANAAGRLAEVDELSRQDGRDPAVIEQTLQEFSDQVSEASALLLDDYSQTGSEESIKDLQEFTVASLAALEDLASVLPPGAQQALVAAGTLLAEINQTAASLCPSCDGDLIGQVPAFLLQAATDLTGPLLDPQASPKAQPAAKPTRSPSAGAATQGGTGPRQPAPSAAPETKTPQLLPAPTPTNGGDGGGKDDDGGTKGGSGTGLLGGLLGGGTSTSSPGSTGAPDLGDVTDPVVDLVEGLLDPKKP